MQPSSQAPNIAAQWFNSKEEMHDILEEWMMAWINTGTYEGLTPRCACKIFILYTYLQHSIRNVNLVE